MNFFASIFNRDPLALFLGEFNINNKNNRRCDLLNRSRLVAYFDLNDGQGSKALLKIVELASYPNINPTLQIKLVMLLHALVLTSPMFYDFILDNEVTMPVLPSQSGSVQDRSIANWLPQATIQYYNYVRRICLHKELYEACKMRNACPESPYYTIQTIYMLMNLMKSILPIKEFILNVGRYYCDEYLFVIDVNRIIALDTLRLYNSVSFLAEQLYHNYYGRLTRQQAGQLVNIVDEIYLLHEELYIMMYNRYYFSFMELSNPYWFRLYNRDYYRLKDYAMDRRSRRNITVDDIDLNSFEQTYMEGERHRRRRTSEQLPDL